MSDMNKILETIEWDTFEMIDIFEIVDGYYNKKPPFKENGEIPFLGATAFNNGVTGFTTKDILLKYDKVGDISDKNINNRLFDGNCITIINNGSVGNVYYQVDDFTCSHDVTPIYLKGRKLNKYVALFLIEQLESTAKSFSYAMKWRPKRIRKSKILLPIDNRGNPNWEFMDQFMKDIEKSMLPNTSFVPHLITDHRELDEIEWKEFKVEELFDPKIGKSIDGNKVNKEGGETPYITRKESLNGLDGFINWNDKEYINKVDEPVITIGNETAKPFVQLYDFFTGTKVNIMTSKKKNVNKHQMLFVAKCLEMNKEKYSYSYTINSTRLRKQKFMLPINNEGDPDWFFMDQYMKRIENILKNKVIFDEEEIIK